MLRRVLAAWLLLASVCFAKEVPWPNPPAPGCSAAEVEEHFSSAAERIDAAWDNYDAHLADVQESLREVNRAFAWLVVSYVALLIALVVRWRRKGVLPAILLLALIPSSCFGQSQQLQDWMYRCAVKVHAADGAGSGVLLDIAGVRYVATNAHVAGMVQRARLTFCNGHVCGGKVIFVDRQMDVCVIQPESEIKYGAKLGCFDAKGHYFSAGFGSRNANYGRLHFHIGKVTRVSGLGNGRWSWTEVGCRICPGDSGSGVYNEAGEVVGVFWGCDSNSSIGTFGTPFAEVFNRLTYDKQQYGGVCGPGGCPTCPPYQQPPIVQGPGDGIIYYEPRPEQPGADSPIQPAPVPDDSPVQQPPAEEPDNDQWVSISERVDALDKRVTALEAKEPTPGPPGPRGEQGVPGPAGKDATVDLDELAVRIDLKALAAELQVNLPPAPSAEPAGQQIFYEIVPRKK